MAKTITGFARHTLRDIYTRATTLIENYGTSMTPMWVRAYNDLATAANTLDAMLARQRVATHQIVVQTPKINLRQGGRSVTPKNTKIIKTIRPVTQKTTITKTTTNKTSVKNAATKTRATKTTRNKAHSR